MCGAALACLLSVCASTSERAGASAPAPRSTCQVTKLTLHYTANGGFRRILNVELPAWYGPKRHPPIPLVIAAHGSGPGPFLELPRAWGDLPTRGNFAIAFPEGQGRELAHYSWGWPGQIDDLARMPSILHQSIPWLRINTKRIYAIGGSMGGMESLLLLARYPNLLAGVAAFDSPADMATRYAQPTADKDLMIREFGGSPDEVPDAYAERSPLHYAQQIAAAAVHTQIWWSIQDQVVLDQHDQAGLLYRTIKGIAPAAPIQEIVGTWAHTAEMKWNKRLPDALRGLGLMPRGATRCTSS
jgi:poly(3-hydroxybutyrate) depolymerase